MKNLKFFLQLSNVYSDMKNDNLMHYSFQYYLMIFLNLIFLVSCHYGYSFVVFWLIYGILPLLDFHVIHDNKNPTKEELKKLRGEFKYKIPIYLTIMIDWVFMIWAVYEINTTEKGLLYKLGVFLVSFTLQGSSFTLSHEVFHKLNKWERMLGTFNLSKSLYMHFFIEHNEGHHKNVSTPIDPASSTRNQTLYQFIPKSIIGGYLSAWEIENRLCTEKYGSSLSLKNRMFYFSACTFLIPLNTYLLFNFKVMITFSVIAIGSVVMLEAINYIEHYDLRRKKMADGTYENVTIKHSWNAPHRVSNYLLFKLQRHSDHHENCLKPYQSLCSYDESPTLPTGYSGCILLAFYPKLWFEIMNPIADVYNRGDKPEKEFLGKLQKTLLSFIYVMNAFSFAMLLMQYLLN